MLGFGASFGGSADSRTAGLLAAVKTTFRNIGDQVNAPKNREDWSRADYERAMKLLEKKVSKLAVAADKLRSARASDQGTVKSAQDELRALRAEKASLEAQLASARAECRVADAERRGALAVRPSEGGKPGQGRLATATLPAERRSYARDDAERDDRQDDGEAESSDEGLSGEIEPSAENFGAVVRQAMGDPVAFGWGFGGYPWAGHPRVQAAIFGAVKRKLKKAAKVRRKVSAAVRSVLSPSMVLETKAPMRAVIVPLAEAGVSLIAEVDGSTLDVIGAEAAGAAIQDAALAALSGEPTQTWLALVQSGAGEIEDA